MAIDEVRPGEGHPEGGLEEPRIVGHRDPRPHLHPHVGQALRHVERVRVLAQRGQELAADGEKLGAHQAKGTTSKATRSRQVRVDAGHEIVGHDAEAARERFEVARRPGLEDVHDAEEHEAEARRPGTKGQEQEGRPLSHHLVHHHDSRVLAPHERRGARRGGDAEAEEREGGRDLDEGREAGERPEGDDPHQRARGAGHDRGVAGTERRGQQARRGGPGGRACARGRREGLAIPARCYFSGGAGGPPDRGEPRAGSRCGPGRRGRGRRARPARACAG